MSGYGRDKLPDLAAMTPHDISITSATDFFGDAVELTPDLSGGLSCFLALDGALHVDDDISYRFQTSADGLTGWADIPNDAINPKWKRLTGNKLENPVSGWQQPIGAAGFLNVGFIRVALKATVLNATRVVTVTFVLSPKIEPFKDWSSEAFPGDNQP
jgi:hypothetical protein